MPGSGGNLPVRAETSMYIEKFRENAILEAFLREFELNIFKTIQEDKFEDGNVILLQSTKWIMATAV